MNALKMYLIKDNPEEFYIQASELCLFLHTVTALLNDDHNAFFWSFLFASNYMIFCYYHDGTQDIS